jgi:hypothetical protein
MFAGQLICGFSVSLTITMKEQVAINPAASVTVQLTVVVPLGNADPDVGLQTTAPAGNVQLSVAVGAG